jgi:hypothetical protein
MRLNPGFVALGGLAVGGPGFSPAITLLLEPALAAEVVLGALRCRSGVLGILEGMTLMEVTYELQSRLQPEQLRALGSFANTYGLRRFRVDEDANRLSFEYDASRLKETEVEHVLRQAKIPVLRRVDPVGTESKV